VTPAESLAEHLKTRPTMPAASDRSVPLAVFAKAYEALRRWLLEHDRLAFRAEHPEIIPGALADQRPQIIPPAPAEREVPKDFSIAPPTKRPGTHPHKKDASYMAEKKRESRARRIALELEGRS
jgi:hypothetical protein